MSLKVGRGTVWLGQIWQGRVWNHIHKGKVRYGWAGLG